ncbi:rab5 GDP/GTP exchange factor-like [Gastrophryne carolinensis]
MLDSEKADSATHQWAKEEKEKHAKPKDPKESKFPKEVKNGPLSRSLPESGMDSTFALYKSKLDQFLTAPPEAIGSSGVTPGFPPRARVLNEEELASSDKSVYSCHTEQSAKMETAVRSRFSFRHHTTQLLCKPDMGAAHEHCIGSELSENTPISRKSYENHAANDTVSRHFASYLVPLGQGNFSDFLKGLHKPTAQELLRQCNSFIQKIQDAKDLTVDKKAEAVQNFYKEIGSHLPDDLSEEKAQLVDNLEKLLLTRLYRSVFCPDGSSEEQKDLALQNHIRSLCWVTPEMLQFSLCEHNRDVKDQIASAISALVEMDSKRAPQDKVACVSRACNHLFKAIEVSSNEPATTDDLISGLVYITLKANPPRLFSNQQYITRFCNPRRLMTGKSAYWFTNFCSASSYIETITFSSLGLTEEEFNNILQQPKPGHCALNGRNITGPVQQSQENKQQLLDLQYRQEILIEKAECLLQEIQAWPAVLQQEVQEILHKFPLDIKPVTS